MTQGFKPLKRPGGGMQKDKPKAHTPKVGKRIAPKKQAAKQEVAQKRVGGAPLTQRNTALSTSRIEREMAGRAAKGPLSIMRTIADQVDKGAKPKK